MWPGPEGWRFGPQIVLTAAEGHENTDIAKRLKIAVSSARQGETGSPSTVWTALTDERARVPSAHAGSWLTCHTSWRGAGACCGRSYQEVTTAVFNGERRRLAALSAAEVVGVQGNDGAGGVPVPRDVLDVAIEAARVAGLELVGRFGREPAGVATKRGIMDLVSDADRAAELAVAAVLMRHRPEDAILAEEGTIDRAGTTGLRWVIDPLDGTVNFLAGIPLFCVSIACEDDSGTVAGVVFDPVRDELFAGVRGGPLRTDGAPAPRQPPETLAGALITGGIACATEHEAQRAGKLAKRLFRRTGQRRALGSAALELAWTAAGRIDVCFHEQWIYPWDVTAGLFLCEQAGLRVHRLAPLEAMLAPRYLAAPELLAAEILLLIGPGTKERRRTAQRPTLSTGSVAATMRRRAS